MSDTKVVVKSNRRRATRLSSANLDLTTGAGILSSAGEQLQGWSGGTSLQQTYLNLQPGTAPSPAPSLSRNDDPDAQQIHLQYYAEQSENGAANKTPFAEEAMAIQSAKAERNYQVTGLPLYPDDAGADANLEACEYGLAAAAALPPGPAASSDLEDV